jgi:hypothetical protein
VVVNLSAAAANVTLQGERPLALQGWGWKVD